MHYKLLAVDMDGTLLNDESVITERTKAAILSALDAGILFVPSTGRPMVAMEFVNALFDADLPFIIFNGAAAIMAKSKKLLFSISLEAEHAAEIYRIGVSRNIPLILWVGERLFVSCDCKETREYQAVSNVESELITDIDALKHMGVTKMIWIDTPEHISEYQREMNEHFAGEVNCHPSRPYFLEFVSKDASKALALEKIGALYGIESGAMIAVGDGYNDLSMLQYAGLGVAMQNAPEAVKAVCQHVTLSNNEDGVAAVIDKYILSKG